MSKRRRSNRNKRRKNKGLASSPANKVGNSMKKETINKSEKSKDASNSKEKKEKTPWWRSSPIKKLSYLSIWSFSIFWLSNYENEILPSAMGAITGLTVPKLNIITLILFYSIMALGSLTVLGLGGLIAKISGLLTFPFILLTIYIPSFLLEAYGFTKKLYKKIPIIPLYFIFLIPVFLIAFNSKDKATLQLLEIPIHLVIWLALGACLTWTLSPLRFANTLKSLIEKLNDYIQKDLSKNLLGKDSDKAKETIKNIPNWIKIYLAGSKMTHLLCRPAPLLFLFLCFLSFAMTVSTIGFAALYRMKDLTSAKSIFGGTAFSGETMDFIYISFLHFTGADLHGYSIVSNGAHYIFCLQSFAYLVLISIIFCAFGSVTMTKAKSQVNETNSPINDGISLIAGIFKEQALTGTKEFKQEIINVQNEIQKTISEEAGKDHSLIQ